ncbi:hypothetical protein PLESTB_000770900 [Pleodorina starrii]|uniref:SET domain-containing protein n=1 Tax=Pleodorina starrii TaxID=330485 RepID=A0A9W6BKP1_9CHLO|nr:hypothetical protein PLESTM_000434200 [Pleodorina starrii]GLC53633.1 hypothetical protein PLESTB_000770900 [Pleodorina starrii]GLC65669.1 hypothetical protein PLESTF_000327200 [Pleodorina starrii]
MRAVSLKPPLQARSRLQRVLVSRRGAAVRSTTKDTVNPAWLEQIYCDASFTAPEHQGLVQVAEIAGRGRGVIAAANLEPGQLVLVSKPLAYVTCPMGAIPSPEELVDAIRESSYSHEELRSLDSLYAGVDLEDEETDGDSELDDMKLFGIIGCNSFGEEFADFPTCAARSANPAGAGTGAGISASGTSSASGTVTSSSSSSSSSSCGDPHPHQVGHLGLFPSFSMLNHSCLPNAVNFVVGGRMMVVAARSIREGSEVLINYLGRASLRPVDERQAQLAEGYHFSCDCPRCRTELLYDCTDAGAAVGAAPGPGPGCSLAEGLQDILARCDERSAELDELGRAAAAGSSGDTGPDAAAAATNPTANTAAALSDLLQRVRQDIRQLDELTRRAVPDAEAGPGSAAAEPPEVRRQWLRASAFDLYSQHAALAEVLGLGGEAAEAVDRQVAVCEAVAPGSDLHMYLEVKRAMMAAGAAGAGAGAGQRQGGGREAEAGGEAEAGREAEAEAWRRCAAVLRGRYGAGLSEGTIAALLRGAVYGLSQVSV